MRAGAQVLCAVVGADERALSLDCLTGNAAVQVPCAAVDADERVLPAHAG